MREKAAAKAPHKERKPGAERHAHSSLIVIIHTQPNADLYVCIHIFTGREQAQYKLYVCVCVCVESEQASDANNPASQS